MNRYEVEFPQQVPIAAFGDLFSWFTKGQIEEHKRDAILAAYNIIGYGGRLVSDAIDSPLVVGDDKAITDESAFNQVGQSAVDQMLADHKDEQVSQAIPAWLVIAAVRYAVKVIMPMLFK